MHGVQVLTEARDASSLETVQIGSELLPTMFYFSGVKRLGRDVNHSPPSSAEFKNDWSNTSVPPRCFDGVERELISSFFVYFYMTPETVNIIKEIILYYEISTTII